MSRSPFVLIRHVNRLSLLTLLALGSLARAASAPEAPPAPAPTRFTADWKSLSTYQVPEWFRDAKFGIFMHWGVQSLPVAADDGWYGRQMYLQSGAQWGHAYQYHTSTYGHPSVFGFKDLIPLWKAERWDPDALAKFYREIGARYIVPVAVHHDNFDLYNSRFQPWNSVNLGPHRDIVGEWKKAADHYGLKFGVSSHADRTWDWFDPAHGADTTGPLKGVPYDGNLTRADGTGKWWQGYDPAELYGPRHAKEEPSELGPFGEIEAYRSLRQAYKEKWFKRTEQLIDDYHPDLLYFDSPMPLGGYGLRIAAHFYNTIPAPVLNIKVWEPGTVPDESAVVLDIEKGQSDRLRPYPWQTDTSLNNNWFIDSLPLELSDEVVVHNLADIVSKNGNLLLNVSLRADGTLPDDQRQALTNVGAWLKQNGEAIYATRPWKIAAEGPTLVTGGDFKQPKLAFTAADIRFTTKGDTLYAILMGWPENGIAHIKSLTAARNIELLGSPDKLTWENSLEGVTVHLPAKPVGRFAYALRITGQESMLAPTNLLAWCIVPYDSLNRTPAERLAMLKRIGFTQYAWDWRQKHLKELPEEIKLSRESGVQLRAVWLWIDDKSDRVGQLSEANRAVIDTVVQAKLSVEYWVGFSPNYFDGLDESSRLKKGAAMVAYLRDQAVVTGSTVALYNHGDWFGEPDNQIKVIQAVGDHSVGLVYNFHHAHTQLAQFPALLTRMLPYLRAVNLDGLRPEGPKILPIGAGTHERSMIKLLQASGYNGAIGIVGHTEGEDVEQVLMRNLAGLKKIAEGN